MALIKLLKKTDRDLRTTNGFQWPLTGLVSDPDFEPTEVCGHGLHAWDWLDLSSNPNSAPGYFDESGEKQERWLIVEVYEDPTNFIRLQGKVKFKEGIVIFVGTFEECTNILQGTRKNHAGFYGTATAGDSGNATAGCSGTATAGYGGTATAGYGGTATAGYGGTATAGYSGTATVGDRGTATAGYRGNATAGNWGTATAGNWGTATVGCSGTATVGCSGNATAGVSGKVSGGIGSILVLRGSSGKLYSKKVTKKDAGVFFKLNTEGKWEKA